MEINSTSGGNQYAILIVMVAGDLKLVWYAAKTDIRREESIDLSVAEFAALPLRATVNKPDNGPLVKWVNLAERGSGLPCGGPALAEPRGSPSFFACFPQS